MVNSLLPARAAPESWRPLLPCCLRGQALPACGGASPCTALYSTGPKPIAHNPRRGRSTRSPRPLRACADRRFGSPYGARTHPTGGSPHALYTAPPCVTSRNPTPYGIRSPARRNGPRPPPRRRRAEAGEPNPGKEASWRRATRGSRAAAFPRPAHPASFQSAPTGYCSNCRFPRARAGAYSPGTLPQPRGGFKPGAGHAANAAFRAPGSGRAGSPGPG